MLAQRQLQLQLPLPLLVQLQLQLPLQWQLFLTWSPSMATRRWCRNRKKKRPLSERSEFRTLPDFGASGVCSPCEARTAIIGAAFSWLLLLAEQEK